MDERAHNIASTKKFVDEQTRLCATYRERDRAMPWDNWQTNLYHPRHPLGFLFHEHHHSVLVRALNALDIYLDNSKILDVGCGYGHWLRYLIELGAQPDNLIGIDLVPERLRRACEKHSTLGWVCAAAHAMPFPAASFDIVMQIVMFSSILNPALRKGIADEMARVVKPGGYVIWLDHQRSQRNGLVGFTPAHVQSFFPRMQCVYKTCVQPRYFRFLYRNGAWLARVLYALTKWWCESWFIILKNNAPSDGSGACRGEIPCA